MLDGEEEWDHNSTGEWPKRERAHQRAEEQEQTHSINLTTPASAGTRPWMERTRLESTYQSLHIRVYIPRTRQSAERRGKTCTLNETLIRLTDHVLDRCEDTMRHTGHTILCWLRSTKHHQAWHSVELVQGAKSNLGLEMGLGLQRPKRGNSCLAAGRGRRSPRPTL
jgi:hypothetical protein